MAEQNKLARKTSLEPVIWSCLLLIAGLALLLYYLRPKISTFISENQIAVPQASIWPILIYFFSVVVVLAIVLFFITNSTLRMVLRLLFALLYGWGIFVILGLVLPLWATLVLAAAAAIAWFLFPLVWL